MYGIISGASSVFQQPARDRFFGITNDNRVAIIGNIVNNVVFRLEDAPYGTASQILAVWRKRVIEDWEKSYGGKVIGFETFVEPATLGERPRAGYVYRYDGWIERGLTWGISKKSYGSRGDGWAKSRYVPTTAKLVFCRWV